MTSDDSEKGVPAPLLDNGIVIDDRYRVLEPLGHGGMGRVYCAEHTTLRRKVALKVLHHQLAGSDEMKRRFEREAFAAARLDHVNCATAFDFGTLADGSPYFVAELLDGVSLREVIDSSGRLPVGRAIHIAGHVLSGLAHMHERGVIHRDIKPDNIMLVDRDGDPDFARILDFGIAKLSDEAEADADPAALGLTSVGVAIGTPAYIAPEQVFGEPIDGRADLYATAVVLFEMLTGRLPFSATSATQLVMKQATEPPPTLAMATSGSSYPPALEEIVARGLAKSRTDRYSDAQQFRDALRAVPIPTSTAAAEPQPDGPVAHASTVSFATPAPPLSPTPAPPLSPTPAPALTPAPPLAPTPTPAAWARDAGQVLQQLPPTVTSTHLPAAPWRGWFWRRWRQWGAKHWSAAIAVILGPIILLAVVCSSGGSSSYGELIKQLRKGKTCEERRAAVIALRQLGDRRAIPHLRRARYRMRGGVLGVGDRNTNHCLKRDADDAIRALSGR